MDLFVACAPGLEPLLADEAAGLGAARVAAVDGGVELSGDDELVDRANLELGLGLKVLQRVARFEARRFAGLVTAVAALPWERWLRPGPLAIKASAARSRLYHTGAVAERLREAIGQRLKGSVREPDAAAVAADEADEAGPSVPTLQVRIVDDVVTLSLDTSGALLPRRGYRLASGKAPLREDVARALLIASGWDRRSALIDPFCGAGTILAEAALLARRLPPGHGRRFAFMAAPGFDAARWERVRARALAAATDECPRLVGSDRDAGAIEAATSNLARAGVTAELACAPMSGAPAWTLGLEAGAVVTNPPWGQRTGKDATLRNLYQSLGTRVRALPGFDAGAWPVAIATSDPRLGAATALDLKPRVRTEFGGTRVHLLARAPRR